MAWREVLEPFAKAFDSISDEDLAVIGIDQMSMEDVIYKADMPLIKDLRRAKRALASPPPVSGEVKSGTMTSEQTASSISTRAENK